MITKKELETKFKEFNKEAKDIFELSFKDKLQGSGVNLHWSVESGILESKLTGPDDEAIKAFCNDLRKFIQKNDSLKIEKLVPFYLSDLVNQAHKRIFGEEISNIDNFLSSNSNHIFNGKNYTNKEILEIFLYGKFVHRTDGQKETHDALEKTPLYLLLKNIFITILYQYLILINNLIYVNNQVLEALKNEN